VKNYLRFLLIGGVSIRGKGLVKLGGEENSKGKFPTAAGVHCDMQARVKKKKPRLMW
jgi:hypothetical protein